jgi:hypothetical protein
MGLVRINKRKEQGWRIKQKIKSSISENSLCHISEFIKLFTEDILCDFWVAKKSINLKTPSDSLNCKNSKQNIIEAY